MKNCLVVLGMHRSGTSALTGMLDLVGVNLGSEMLETQQDNPKGFFENKYVVKANDCILESLKTSWDDTFPLPNKWVARFEGSQLSAEISAFLQSEIKEDVLFAFKDPRLSKLLPLWMPLFRDAEIKPHFVLLIRNPLETADSLNRRDGFSTEKSLILWMQHMLEAERCTRNQPRSFVSFDKLLKNPQDTIRSVFSSTGLPAPEISDGRSAALSQFVDGNLRNHQVSDAEMDAKCFDLVARFYSVLCRISEHGDTTLKDIAELDVLGHRFKLNQALFYNKDVMDARERSESRTRPECYESNLQLIKRQFETDKVYREYRYLANTEFLYKDRAALRSEAGHLEYMLDQTVGSRHWRLYKRYQQSLEKWLPQGALPRRLLQRSKQILSGLLGFIVNIMTRRSAPDTEHETALNTLSPQNQIAPIAGTTPEEEPRWEPLTFATSNNPTVSIIIPVFNNWHFTLKCLQSVHEHTVGSYELIVVDNNSTDITPQLLASMQGIVVITNESNEVFVSACNQAAAIANGEYILLLNNDTEVSPHWIAALLEPFKDSSTGIVGGKLVYPDGRLQEAGGIIWRDGTGCNYGHGDDPELPSYCYKKAVDYCSGACLMITRKLWEEIGGFDKRYAPAYYEDTDLCFTVRSMGYKVIYQPNALVIHYGGASAGKETTSGYKRFQEINRHKFVDKWASVLEQDHFPSSENLLQARERTTGKSILVIDHYVPTFDRDSGSVRMFSMLQILQSMGYKVSFWPDHLPYKPRYTKALQDIGVETFYGDMEFENFIRERGNEFDVIMMSRPATAIKYIHLVKKYSNAQTIFDTVDLHFVREQRRLELEVQQWKNTEFYLAEETDATLVVSPTEKELLSEESFSEKVSVISNIHSLEPCEKSFEERQGIMFIGGFAHPPNEEGVIWFIDYILPIIQKKIPDLHLTIVGSDPTDRLLALANEFITVTGYVEDVSCYFNDSRVFVSPLLHGAGVKGKIGQSLSYGLPVVTTNIGAEGMALQDGHNAMITDSEKTFADKVIELYTDHFLWQKISANSRQVIRDQFSTTTIRNALQEVLSHISVPSTLTPSSPRPVIVHCHLFKNAGTTFDWTLKRQFGPKFEEHRNVEEMGEGASFLGPYLQQQNELSAISSHRIRFPLPVLDDVEILPILALRHPIERARSVYDFLRRQEADNTGATQAKNLSFRDYVLWGMESGAASAIRNFHCSYCTSTFARKIGEADYDASVELLLKTPGLIIVERYDESMLLLERYLGQHFRDIDLSYIRQNASPKREGDLQHRVEAIYSELGTDLTKQFREQNHWDMELYENAQRIFEERLSSLGRKDALMAGFQARCQSLVS